MSKNSRVGVCVCALCLFHVVAAAPCAFDLEFQAETANFGLQSGNEALHLKILRGNWNANLQSPPPTSLNFVSYHLVRFRWRSNYRKVGGIIDIVSFLYHGAKHMYCARIAIYRNHLMLLSCLACNLRRLNL